MLWFENRGDTVCTVSVCLKDLKIQTVLDAGFFLHRKSRDPNTHAHLNYELYFVENGTCVARCNGRDYTCQENDFLCLPIGAEHHVAHLSEDASIYSFRFSLRSDGEETLAQLQSPIQGVLPEGIALLKEIRWEFAKQLPLCQETVEGLFGAFYSRLFRKMLYDAHLPEMPQAFSVKLTNLPGYRKNIPQEFYIDLLDEFFTHLPLERNTLTDLAERLHMSVSQTQRLVKSHYGMSFQQKLIQSKIQKSKRLISTTDLSLEEISQRVGYNSYNAFFEAFLAQTGESPSQHRESCI